MTTAEARRAILKSIIEAQIASDAGKEIYADWPRRIRNYNRLLRDGYKAKDRLINQAVKLIAQFPKAGVEYYFQKEEGEYELSLIYFSFSLNGKKKQVSFHSPNHHGLKIPASKDSYAVYWDGDLGGSREACQEACQFVY